VAIDVTATTIAIAAALFTAAQAYFQRRQTVDQRTLGEDDSFRRLKERNDEEVRRRRQADDEQDAAFISIWTEHFRLDSVANQWEAADLIERALLGLLDPKIALPENTQHLVANAAKLGRESGFLAAVAATLAADTAFQTAQFNRLATEALNRGSKELTPMSPSERVRNRHPEIRDLEIELKRGAKELALLWWDVARHSPRAEVERTLDFRDDIASQFGRQAIEGLAERAREAGNDTPTLKPWSDTGAT
jgi:hypothetical protein